MTRRICLAIICLFTIAIFAGCANDQAQVVSLSKIDPQIIAKHKVSDHLPLRVLVSSIVSPKETLTVYQPLVDYLEEQLGYPVILLQRRTYKEVNDLLQNSGADVAFVCSGGYVAGNRSFGMELLAVPEVNGERLYQSYIIARERKSQSILDLRSRSFAFTDPMSFSGSIAPVYMLVSQGIDSNHFFSRTFFTYSHDNAIQAVADGIADAAAVDSMIFDRALEKDPELGKRVYIIDKSLRVGNPPVVVNPTIDSVLKQRLQYLLLTMQNSDAGRKALRALNYQKFVVAEDGDYTQLKTMWLLVKEKL